MKERPKLRTITEQMKEWTAVLDSELVSWPDVTRKLMFGMIVFYHRDVVFAALPRTKSFGPENSVAFKIDASSKELRTQLMSDSRLSFDDQKPTPWITFELHEPRDVNDALKWFENAYQNTKR